MVFGVVALIVATIPAQPLAVCSSRCFDAMIAVNYANFTTLGVHGDPTASHQTPDRSVSGGLRYITTPSASAQVSTLS